MYTTVPTRSIGRGGSESCRDRIRVDNYLCGGRGGFAGGSSPGQDGRETQLCMGLSRSPQIGDRGRTSPFLNARFAVRDATPKSGNGSPKPL